MLNDSKTFEALLIHPKPMGRPFLNRWITIHALTLSAARDAAAAEARLCGWKLGKVKQITPAT